MDFSKITVLLVEDNDFVRFSVKGSLEKFGVGCVLEAGNGMDGLEQLAKGPDIVICDINMEPVNGLEFLKLLRKSPGVKNDLPVIFLTSDGDVERVRQAQKLQVDAYLLKPVKPDILKKKIITVMSQTANA